MKLISMTDFVLEQNKNLQWTDNDNLQTIINYAEFLKQPLELWMVVPCDENGNILEDPDIYGEESEELDNYRKEFQQAKERCLFEGFYVKDGIVFTPGNIVMVQKSLLEKITVENILGYGYKLTQTAIKQLGL